MRIISTLLSVFLLTVASAPAAAQAPAAGENEAAVLAVVSQLFDGMRARDSVALRTAFHPEARLHGVAPNGAVQVVPAATFVNGIMSAPAGLLLDEVLHDIEVRIDGPLATVWTYYDFFAGDNFSHCGYNAFQLLETGEGWKIIAVTDSRRREGCRQQRN